MGGRARQGNVWIGMLLLVLVGGYCAWRYGTANGGKHGSAGDPNSANQIVMKEVTIEAFDDKFVRTTLMKGERAVTYKDRADVVLEPVDGIIFRETGGNVFVKAARVQKSFQGGEHYDFTGSVVVTCEGRKLLSEHLIYSTANKVLESSAPVQILTTGSLILAEHMRTQTDLKSGVLEGNVDITTLGEGDRSYDAPVRIRGSRSNFDLPRSLYDVQGDAQAWKTDSDIKANKLIFNQQRATLTAIGNAVVRKPDLEVTAGHVEYFTNRETGVATEGPKAVQMTPATTNESESKSELIAKQMEVDFKRAILDAHESVVHKRFVKFEREWQKDYAITSDNVLSLYNQGRSTFRGNVHIDAEKIGATGDRAIFYQQQGKFYIVGRAHAWDYDEEHKQQNEIEGEKIVHNIRTGKSMVLDRVKSRIQEGTGKGSRPIFGPPQRQMTVIREQGGG